MRKFDFKTTYENMTKGNYNVNQSVERIDKILGSSVKFKSSYNRKPDKDNLTNENGYYVTVGSIFIDIRGSSKLPLYQNKIKLSKLYRCYISEIIAILKDWFNCIKIDIIGDCVSGIYYIYSIGDVQYLFETGLKINSLIKILNYKLIETDISPISIGIGIDVGNAVMIKVGNLIFEEDNIVWMGNVVNSASNLCNKANKCEKGISRGVLLVSNNVYCNLSGNYQKLLKFNEVEKFYEGNIFYEQMERWYKENCNLIPIKE